MSAPHAVDLEVLIDLEQQFYDAGYEDGFEHGVLHGRIEGRELGREKGFEMWEELGYYEGFAKFWNAISEHKQVNDSRMAHNAKLMLDLIAQFPMGNPSHIDFADVDIPKLFGQIRARYKMLCVVLGIKPNLRASQTQTSPNDGDAALGPLEKNNVWIVETAQSSGSVDYSF